MAPQTTEFPGYFDTNSLITIICAVLAGYNAIELVILILITFNDYRNLYFCSISVATLSIFPYVIGMTLMFFAPNAKLAGLIINNISWVCLLVAQSLVLYSRLGIVLGNMKSKILIFTKWMIIVDSIVFYTIATVIVFGMQYSSDRDFTRGYIYSERIQMTGFCIQEFIISGLYIWKTLDILKAGEKRQARRTLWELLSINVVIVGLDVGLLVVEYLNHKVWEISFKAVIYSIKLKLEFAILNKLVESSSVAHRNMSVSFDNTIVLHNDSGGDMSGNQCGLTRSTLRSNSADNVPKFLPWVDDTSEKHKGEHDELEAQSHDSLRTTSHQTENSEQHLVPRTVTQSTSNVQSDSYHDMIRSMTG